MNADDEIIEFLKKNHSEYDDDYEYEEDDFSDFLNRNIILEQGCFQKKRLKFKNN